MANTTKNRLIEALTKLAEDASTPAKQRIDAARLVLILRGDIAPDTPETALDLLKE